MINRILTRSLFSRTTIVDLKNEPIHFLNQKYRLLASDMFNSPIHLDGNVDNNSIDTYLDQLQKYQEFQKQSRKEFIVLGRSNVGKSSLINALFNRNIGAISNYPGKTRQLYFYSFSQNRFLIDSPGYGFAKGNKKDIQNWGTLMQTYIKNSPYLKQIYILIDGEHGIKDVDIMTINLVNNLKKPITLCFTKCDKITDEKHLTKAVEKQLKDILYSSQVFHLTSAKSLSGIKELQCSIAYYCE